MNSERFKDAGKLAAQISDYVLTTVHDKTQYVQEGKDTEKEAEPRLFKLEILTQEMEEYKKSRT